MKTSPQTLRRNAALLRRDTTGGARRATFRLVTPAVDRHGTVILPEGVDIAAHKAAGSPFLWMHESGGFGAAPSPDVVIGRVVEYQQSSAALDIVVEFHDDGPQGLASRCWEKVQAGLLRMVSIGCSVIASETRKVGGQDVMVFTRSELWEASLVIIGSNREALRLDRAAAIRALDNLTKETAKMDKAALCKMLGIEESATREEAEKACMDYLVKTDDAEARKAAAAALDEHFPESASGEDETRSEDGDKDEELEALRGANAELQRALTAAQATRAAAPTPAKVADDAAQREAALAKDVDQWVTEGRIKREERATWLEKHRKGKAAKVVRHLPAGTWTTSQRLATAPGAPVKVETPTAPAKGEPGKAPSLVQRFAAQQAAERGIPLDKIKN